MFQSQEAACDAILADKIVRRRRRGHRLRGPEGRPGHAGDAVPDVVPEGQRPRQGLRAHHRRPVLAAARPGLSIGHVSPEAGEGGAIGLVEEGDRIRIDIPARRIDVLVDAATLAKRRARHGGARRGRLAPQPRPRRSPRRSARYALMTTSAARGAVRDLSQLQRRGR